MGRLYKSEQTTETVNTYTSNTYFIHPYHVLAKEYEGRATLKLGLTCFAPCQAP